MYRTQQGNNERRRSRMTFLFFTVVIVVAAPVIIVLCACACAVCLVNQCVLVPAWWILYVSCAWYLNQINVSLVVVDRTPFIGLVV